MPPATKHEVISEIIGLYLSDGNPVRFWVISNSMKPLLQIGDAAIVEAVTFNELKIGDVIVVQRKDDYLTHRLIYKSQKKWLTKGDNNLMPDHSAQTDKIAGKVIQIRRSEKEINLRTRKWQFINPLIARISFFEWKFFLVHRYLRIPSRITIKVIQKFFMQ